MDRTSEHASDRLSFNASTKIGNNDEVFAVLSDTTGDMNKFGQLLEQIGTHQPYCINHTFHFTCKKLHEDVIFEEGRTPSIGSAPVYTKKTRKLVVLFNKTAQ